MSGEGVQAWWCPACGHKLDAATGVGHDRRPKEGDLSVCFYCAALLVFDAHGAVDRPADESALLQSLTLDQRRQIESAQAFIRQRRGVA